MKNFILGILVGVLLVGCAGFSYHYYGMDGVEYSGGKLLGPQPKDDLDFKVCAPNAQNKHPCVVMLTSEFFAFKQDYIDTQNKLKTCESGKAQTQ